MTPSTMRDCDRWGLNLHIACRPLVKARVAECACNIRELVSAAAWLLVQEQPEEIDAHVAAFKRWVKQELRNREEGHE